VRGGDPAKGFKAGQLAFEGRRHSYKLFEKKTRLREVGLMRTILFLGEDRQHIRADQPGSQRIKRPRSSTACGCAGVENSFKFPSENYAIDQIIQYGADPETEDRLVPNPKRKALKEDALAHQADPGPPGTTGPRCGRQ
jgi:hypothetical protein